VLRYLGRYTHRIAMSNHRLLCFDGERVTIRWKDYAHGNKQKKMTLGSDGVPPPLYPAHPATGLRPHTAIRIPHEHPTVHHAGARPKASRRDAEAGRGLCYRHRQRFDLAVPALQWRYAGWTKPHPSSVSRPVQDSRQLVTNGKVCGRSTCSPVRLYLCVRPWAGALPRHCFPVISAITITPGTLQRPIK
jgi:hypothetical protein